MMHGLNAILHKNLFTFGSLIIIIIIIIIIISRGTKNIILHKIKF